MAKMESTLAWYLFSESALREALQAARDGEDVDDALARLYLQGHPDSEDETPGGVKVFEVEVTVADGSLDVESEDQEDVG